MGIKLFFLFAILCTQAIGQKEGDWKLKMDKEGIVVYSKSTAGSRFKAIKVECTFATTLSQLVKVLLDIKTTQEWLYSTKSCVLLKQVSPLELYYYSEVNIPWPLSNRDFVAHLKVVQDPHTKIVTMHGPAIEGYVPVKPTIVRVTHSESNWVITPIAKNLCRVEYILQVDPGGSIPVWLINLFAAKGPYETFKKLEIYLKKHAYNKGHSTFIVDY